MSCIALSVELSHIGSCGDFSIRTTIVIVIDLDSESIGARSVG
jgi:hypothetical protein